jgi:D-alanyl-lipoteichoic acid acyltransferase DltB (MBOAT superfamily)
MLFNSFQFALFLVTVFAFHRSAPQEWRNGILLAASLVFYFLWIPPYLDLLVNYALVRGIQRSPRKRLYVAASVVFSLGILAGFKYTAFLVGSFTDLPVPEILLPLGISFFTFQIIALSVDSYRGATPPVQSLREYALFISFFPQLIAGPILRGSMFLPQLRAGGRVSPDRTRRGLWLLASGLVKKVVVADFLLAPYVDDVFRGAGVPTSLELWVALYSFAFQIYCDFSGYTDMARGMGLLLGFELPKNFTEPYLSRNPAEFWQRWHITLSTWLRDYLFLTLGGNRHGRLRSLRNLAVTMVLGGLWHGAAWTFVLWGAYHGVLLVLHRVLQPVLVRVAPGSAAGRFAWQALRVAAMFHLVCLGYLVFRAESLAQLGALLPVLGGLAGPASDATSWPGVQLGIVALCAGLHGLERFLRPRLPAIRRGLEPTWGGVLEGAAMGAVAALAIWLGGAGGEFIYFQF